MRLLAQWRELTAASRSVSRYRDAAPMVILPPEPIGLVASLGDAAMLAVVIEHARASDPGRQIFIATGSKCADDAARALGCDPVRVLDHPVRLSQSLERLCALGCGSAVLIGADVLDGSLDPVFSAQLLALLHLLGVTGHAVAVAGFSVGPRPNPGLREIFVALQRAGALHVRDPVSQRRLAAFIGAQPRLVADLAFLLRPAITARSEPTLAWIGSKRQAGRRIIAFNLHPFPHHLQPTRGRRELVARAGELLAMLAGSADASFVLLSHDNRPLAGDRLVLEPLALELQRTIGDDVHVPSWDLRADEVKAVVSRVDAVVTARMHLAISSLGCGKPTLVIGGPEKLDGLLEHFGLDPSCRIGLEDFLQPEVSRAWFRQRIDGLDALRERVLSRLDGVRALARIDLGRMLSHDLSARRSTPAVSDAPGIAVEPAAPACASRRSMPGGRDGVPDGRRGRTGSGR